MQSPAARPTSPASLHGQQRRQFLILGASAALAACVPNGPAVMDTPRGGIVPRIALAFDPNEVYAAMPDDRFPLDAVDLTDVDDEFLRTIVPFSEPVAPGTIVIDTSERHLFLVQSGGTAIRYGVGVGREGATWRGRARIARKAEWAGWTPTARMIRYDPEKNGPWAGGMPGGPDNPLGARSLYLYDGNRDTMYRIHGTNEPWSIGKNVSSGCIRLINHDIIDLHARAPIGTPVIVRD